MACNWQPWMFKHSRTWPKHNRVSYEFILVIRQSKQSPSPGGDRNSCPLDHAKGLASRLGPTRSRQTSLNVQLYMEKVKESSSRWRRVAYFCNFIKFSILLQFILHVCSVYMQYRYPLYAYLWGVTYNIDPCVLLPLLVVHTAWTCTSIHI